MTYFARTPRLLACRTRVKLSLVFAALALLAIARITPLRAQSPTSVLDLAGPGSVHDHHAAQDELARARENVAKARQAVAGAKAELDRLAAETEAAPDAVAPNEPSGASPESAEPSPEPSDEASTAADVSPDTTALAEQVETLTAKIKSLRDQRDELLTHLTPAHPLVIEAESRLEEYTRRLHDAAGAGTNLPIRRSFTPETSARPPSAGADALERRHREASARMQQALADWQIAEQSLQAAIDGELAAAEKLAAVAARAGLDEHATSAAANATPVAAASPEPSKSPGRSSQALVLAALIIALVVAALASVKLARSSDETMFSGPDDAAAALALPVLGVIPAMSAAVSRAPITRRFRTAVILGQAVLAVAVFAIVAYLVQNPAIVVQLVTAPLEALRALGR
jgi:hypothetical protein